jgi:hypothetical protein
MSDEKKTLNVPMEVDPVEIMAWEIFYGSPVSALMVPHGEIVGVESIGLSADKTRAQVTVTLADDRRIRFYFAPHEPITAGASPKVVEANFDEEQWNNVAEGADAAPITDPFATV